MNLVKRNNLLYNIFGFFFSLTHKRIAHYIRKGKCSFSYGCLKIELAEHATAESGGIKQASTVFCI